MKILYIAHRIPYPPNKGDKIRAFHEVKALAERAEVFLCALVDDPEDWKHESALRKFCSDVTLVPLRPYLKKILALQGFFTGKPMSVLYFYEKKLQEAVDRLLEEHDFDGIICFSGTSAEYVFKSKQASKLVAASCDRPRLIMDFCDVDSLKWREYAQRSNFPIGMIYRAEWQLLARFEAKTAQYFDNSILITEHEKQLFSKHVLNTDKLMVVGNGVDTDYFKPVPDIAEEGPAPKKPPEMLFVGAMDYHANIDGVCWFVEAVWPKITEQYPEALFTIVGRNPAQKVLALRKHRNIMVTGSVDDVRPYYQRATIVIVPLRIARGIQNKVLEAMAMGKAVVVSRSAFTGLEVQPGRDLLVADNELGFADCCNRLLGSPGLNSQLSVMSRKSVEVSYTWEKAMEVLATTLCINRIHAKMVTRDC